MNKLTSRFPRAWPIARAPEMAAYWCLQLKDPTKRIRQALVKESFWELTDEEGAWTTGADKESNTTRAIQHAFYITHLPSHTQV